jgi:hypothetical protein
MALINYPEFWRKAAESHSDNFEALSRKQLEGYRDYFAQSLKQPDPMGTTRETAKNQVALLKPEIAARRRLEHGRTMKFLAVAGLVVAIFGLTRCPSNKPPVTPVSSISSTPLATSPASQVTPSQFTPSPTASAATATPTVQPSQSPALSPTPVR